MGLPVGEWTPREVIETVLPDMSLEDLLLATKEGHFYTAKSRYPNTGSDGIVYPAWQFVEPVPALLPAAIKALVQLDQGDALNSCFLKGQDELNELSPAEVLAGRVFVGQEPSSSQLRLLNKPAEMRLELVMQCFELVADRGWQIN